MEKIEKYTQKELKRYIEKGLVKDITRLSEKEIKNLRENENGFETIGLSMGTYGMNGGIFQGLKSKKYYVITARNGNLFYLV